jgi:hypothetical protein
MIIRIILRFSIALTAWLMYSWLIWMFLAPINDITAVYTIGILSILGLFVAIGFAGKSLVAKR